MRIVSQCLWDEDIVRMFRLCIFRQGLFEKRPPVAAVCCSIYIFWYVITDKISQENMCYLHRECGGNMARPGEPVQFSDDEPLPAVTADPTSIASAGGLQNVSIEGLGLWCGV